MDKKPIYKRKWFIIIAAILGVGLAIEIIGIIALIAVNGVDKYTPKPVSVSASKPSSEKSKPSKEKEDSKPTIDEKGQKQLDAISIDAAKPVCTDWLKDENNRVEIDWGSLKKTPQKMIGGEWQYLLEAKAKLIVTVDDPPIISYGIMKCAVYADPETKEVFRDGMNSKYDSMPKNQWDSWK